MDMLRSCYYSKMAIYRDRPDVLVSGRWHFCPDGALPVPFTHTFASRNWIDRSDRQLVGMGEADLRGAYSRGESDPLFTGQRVCGSAFVWRNGALFRQRGNLPVVDGIPVCCVPGARLFFGGAEASGSAAVTYIDPQLAEGGLLLDGEGSFGVGYEGDGGLLLDGEGSFGVGYEGDGGLLLDGQGVQGGGFDGGGGLLLDGQGVQGGGFDGGGGLELDGLGVQGGGFAGGGGLELDGLGVQGGGFAGGGGLELDGLGVQGGGFAGGGGLELDGLGEFPTGDDTVIGMIVGWGSTTIPSGWKECNGQTLSQAGFPDLYAILGNTFGSDAGGNFTLPDLRGRAPIGQGTGSGLTNRVIGTAGGAETVALATAELPSHTHAQQTSTYVAVAGASQLQTTLIGGINVNQGGTTQATGSGTAHANMQPYLPITWIIKT